MNNIFSRLAIGTANFGKEYNGIKVPEKDIEKILGFCQCSGIDMLDCATAYGWDWTQANSYFNKVVKVKKGDDIEKIAETEPYCVMAHSIEDYRSGFLDVIHNKYGAFTGASIYSVGEEEDIDPGSIVQIPYSLYDRRFEPHFEQMCLLFNEIHVRSIFLRGKIIEDGISPQECLKFVLANPYVDRIIIGVESFERLQRNLDFIFKWNNLKKDDLDIIDPRRWKK